MSDRKQSQRQGTSSRLKAGGSALTSGSGGNDIFDNYRQRVVTCYRNRIMRLNNVEETSKGRGRQRRRGTDNEDAGDVQCNVCLLTGASSQFSSCSVCGISFHRECFTGLSADETTPVICDSCAFGNNKKSLSCAVCSTGSSNGMLRRAKTGEWLHVFCGVTNNLPLSHGGDSQLMSLEGVGKGSAICQICNTSRGLVKQCSQCAFLCHTNCAGAQNYPFFIEDKRVQYLCPAHDAKILPHHSDDDITLLDLANSSSSSSSFRTSGVIIESMSNSSSSSSSSSNISSVVASAATTSSLPLKMIASDVSAPVNITHTIQAFTKNLQNLRFFSDGVNAVRPGDAPLPSSEDSVQSHLLQLVHKKSNTMLHNNTNTATTAVSNLSALSSSQANSSLHKRRLARAAQSSRRSKMANVDIIPTIDNVASLHTCLDLQTAPLTGENLIAIGSYLPLLQHCVLFRTGLICARSRGDVVSLHIQPNAEGDVCNLCKCKVNADEDMSDQVDYIPSYLPTSMIFNISKAHLSKYGIATLMAPSGDEQIWHQVKTLLLEYNTTISSIGSNNDTIHFKLPFLESEAVNKLMSLRTVSQFGTQQDPAFVFPAGTTKSAQYFLSSTALHATPKHVALSVGNHAYKDLTPTGIYTDGHADEVVSPTSQQSQPILSPSSLDPSSSTNAILNDPSNGTVDLQNTANWSLQVLPNTVKLAKLSKDGFANTSVTAMVPAAILDNIHGTPTYSTGANTQQLVKLLGLLPEQMQEEGSACYQQALHEASQVLQPYQLYPSVFSGVIQRTSGQNYLVEYIQPPLLSIDLTEVNTSDELLIALLSKAVLSRTSSVVNSETGAPIFPVKYLTPSLLSNALKNVIQKNISIPSIHDIMNDRYSSYLQPTRDIEGLTEESIPQYDHTSARVLTPSVLDFARKHEFLGEWGVFTNSNLYEKEGCRLQPSMDEQSHIRQIDDYAAWNSLLVHQQKDAFSTVLTRAVDRPESIVDDLLTEKTSQQPKKKSRSNAATDTVSQSLLLPEEQDEVSVSLMYLQHLLALQMQQKERQISRLRQKITFSHTSVVFWEHRTYTIRLLANQRQLHAWQNLVRRLCANMKDISVSSTHCRNIVLLSLRSAVASKVHEYHGFVKTIGEELDAVGASAEPRNLSQEVIIQMTKQYSNEIDSTMKLPDSTDYIQWLLHARGVFVTLLDVYSQYLQHILSITETLHKGVVPDVIYPFCNNVSLQGQRGSLEVDPRSCSVCFDLASYDDDPLLQCDYCQTSVHRNCYGLGRTNINPGAEWTCASCQSYKRYTAGGKHTCALCPFVFGCLKPADLTTAQEDTRAEKLGGSMLDTLTKYAAPIPAVASTPLVNAANQTWVHPICALWCNDVAVADIAQMELITGVKEAVKRNTTACSLCNTAKGAVVKCCATGCDVYMHPLCGWFAGNVLSANSKENLKLNLEQFCVNHTANKHVVEVYPALLVKQMPQLQAIATSFQPTNSVRGALFDMTVKAMQSNYAEIYTVSDKDMYDKSVIVVEEFDGVEYSLPVKVQSQFRTLLQQELRLRYRATLSASLSTQQRGAAAGFGKMKKKVPTLSNHAAGVTGIEEVSFAEDVYDPHRCAVCFKMQRDITAEGVWSAALVTLMETSYHSYLHHYKNLVLQYNATIKHNLLAIAQNHQYTVPAEVLAAFEKTLDRNVTVASRLKQPFLVNLEELVAVLPGTVGNEVLAACRQLHVPHFDNNFINTRMKPSVNLPPGAGAFLSPWELYHSARRRALGVYGADRLLQCAECHVSVHQSCYGVTQEALETYFRSGDVSMKWYCDVCSQQPATGASNDRHVCALCPRKGGALKAVTGQTQRFAHVVCALWTSHVSFVCPTTRTGILLNKYSSKLYKNHRCYVCLRAGATCVCNVADCPHSYHYLCNAFAGGYSNITLDVPSLTNATAVTLCVAHTPLQLSRTSAKYNRDVQLLNSTKSALMQVIKSAFYDEHYLTTLNSQISTLLYQYELAIKRNLLCYVPSTIGSQPMANEISRIIKQNKLNNAHNNNGDNNSGGGVVSSVHNESRMQVSQVNNMLLSQQLIDLPLLTLGSVAIATIRAASCLCSNRNIPSHQGGPPGVMSFCTACNSPHLPLQNITLAHVADTAAIKLHLVEPVIQPNPMALSDSTAPSHVYCHPGVVSNAVRLAHGPLSPTDHDFSAEQNFLRNVINDQKLIAEEQEEHNRMRKALLATTPALEQVKTTTSAAVITTTTNTIPSLPMMTSSVSNAPVFKEEPGKAPISVSSANTSEQNVFQPLQPTATLVQRKKRHLEEPLKLKETPTPILGKNASTHSNASAVSTSTPTSELETQLLPFSSTATTSNFEETLASPLKKKKSVKPFNIGDRPTIEEDGVRHTVIVKRVDMNNGDPKYEVHYHNWSSRYDKWVFHKDLSL